MKILFVERLTELMKERGLIPVRLSEKVGIKQNTISRWLNGKTEPSITSLWLLADYFKVSVDFLIRRKEY